MRVCYHSAYPLAHIPTSIIAHRAWLVLDGDLQAPNDRRQPAVLLDDGAPTLAEWWRTPEVVVPGQGRSAEGIQFTVTTGEHDVRGKLSYSDLAVVGQIWDYTIARGWGMEEERRSCPAPK